MVDFSLFEKTKDKILNGDIPPLRSNPYEWKQDGTLRDDTEWYYDIEKYLNEDRLNIIINEYGDLEFANLFLGKNNARLRYSHSKGEINKILIDLIGKAHNCVCKSTGRYWYPPNGFCGWHTNSNLQFERIYAVWAEEDNKSFFRYKDEETGEIVTKWQKQGWQINRFKPPVWHCIGSYTNRVSFGYRIIPSTYKIERLK